MKEIQNIIKKIIGVFLILFGIISFFLPFFQGILLILLGFILLGNHKLKNYIIKLTKTLNKKIKTHIYLLIRYIILLILIFSLPLIYRILTPLTVYSTAYLLKIFYQVSINKNTLLIFPKSIQIIPACVAGSAYLLTLILNLSISMKTKKRIKSILFAIILLFTINILRIFILSILFIEDSQLFYFTHKLFWYFFSTIFVIAIWFLTIKVFSIKKIPVYDDMKYLIKNMKKR